MLCRDNGNKKAREGQHGLGRFIRL
jgi:hypothetical protein